MSRAYPLTLLLFPLVVLAGCSSSNTGQAPDTSGGGPVEYLCGNEKLKGVLYTPPAAGHSPGLILIHGDFGPTDFEKAQARRLARNGYVVLVVDLYRGKAVTNQDMAHEMDRGLSEDRVLGDLRAA